MPFKSSAQMRFLFSQHPDIAKRWAKETPNIKKLPNHVNQMTKKTILKKAVGKYKGKGGPGMGLLNDVATGVYNGVNKVGSDIGQGVGAIGSGIKNGIQSFAANNPITAFMGKMKQNQENNALINRAAKKGFKVPNNSNSLKR